MTDTQPNTATKICHRHMNLEVTHMNQVADMEVGKHFINQMPMDIQRLRRLAIFDLYHGSGTKPRAGKTWPGFFKATELLGQWADQNLAEVWYDIESGEVLPSVPEGYYGGYDVEDEVVVGAPRWIEPCWEDYIHFDHNDVKRAVFGKELAAHIPISENLIDAAPEMYKAIKTALIHFDESCVGTDTWKILRMALDKATQGMQDI